MRNLTFLAILLAAGCSTFSKKPTEMGSLKGNVFWKYNNYVGNKPDAGTSIKLYSLLDTSYLETATCDVQATILSTVSPPDIIFLLLPRRPRLKARLPPWRIFTFRGRS